MLYAIVGMLVIILDQGVKFWVTNHIMLNTVTEPLIPGVISLVRMHNDGAAFSFLAGGGARIYFIILTAIFTIAVIIALVTNFISGRFGRWCLVLVTAGGLSNCLDRILYGYVVDMFKVELFNFAVFNVADIFITVFCLLFIVYIIFGGEDEKESLDEFDYDDEDMDRPSLSKGRSRKDKEEERAEKAAAKLAKRDKRRGAKYEDEFDEPASGRGAARKRAARAEQEEEPAGRAGRKRPQPEAAAPRAQAPAGRAAQSADRAPARPPRSGKSRYEEEYEAFMASRPNAKQEMGRSSAAASRSAQAEDPFAAWERANAKVESRQNSGFTAKAMGVAKPAAKEEEELSPPARPAARRGAAPEGLRREAPAAPAAEEAVKKPAPAPAAPAAPAQPSRPKAPAPAPKANDALDFSLDDILSEFR